VWIERRDPSRGVCAAAVRGLLAIAAILAVLAPESALSAQPSNEHAHSPVIGIDDILRFAVIGDPRALSVYDNGGDAAVYSPDGRYAAVVVRTGVPERNVYAGEVIVYDLRDLAVPGRTVARLESATDYYPVAHLAWLPDSRRLLFMGASGEAGPELFIAGLDLAEPRRVTRGDDPIASMGVSLDGRIVAIQRSAYARPMLERPECIALACRVRTGNLYALEQGAARAARLSFVDLSGDAETPVAEPQASLPDLRYCDTQLQDGVSPDGAYVLRLCTFSTGADDCVEYEAECRKQLVITELRTGISRRVTDAHEGFDRMQPIWIEGGRALAVAAPRNRFDASLAGMPTGANLTIMSFDAAALRPVEVQRFDASITRVVRLHWDRVAWGLRFALRGAGDAGTGERLLRRRGDVWRQVAAGPEAPVRRPIQLVVEQGLNTRPRLVATGLRTQRAVLLDPNRWLDDRRVARTEPISWRASDGRIWSGGLTYPINYVPGRRYPLVIQTHGFRPDRFSLHGYSTNFAGQALAAQDVAVLQVAENTRGVLGTRDELPAVLRGYESAVRKLVDDGLVNVDRVAIQGWSRTGSWAAYAQTHSNLRFAASAYTATADFGGWWYYASGMRGDVDPIFGGAPFGTGLEGWLEASPNLNVHRWYGPTLIFGDHSPNGNWDWYGGLRRVGVPVEYWLSAEGPHEAYQLGLRRQLGQMLLDWFSFWLKDAERSQPLFSNGETQASLAAQYGRWSQYRRRQIEIAAQRRPPLFDWSVRPAEVAAGSPAPH
jgi:dipeptidyl aminopeptidase/acylaminoacyl peptidase